MILFELEFEFRTLMATRFLVGWPTTPARRGAGEANADEQRLRNSTLSQTGGQASETYHIMSYVSVNTIGNEQVAPFSCNRSSSSILAALLYQWRKYLKPTYWRSCFGGSGKIHLSNEISLVFRELSDNTKPSIFLHPVEQYEWDASTVMCVILVKIPT